MRIDEAVSKYVPEHHKVAVSVTSFSLWALVAYGVMLLSFTLGDIAKEFNMSEMEISTLASSTFIGMLLGALSSGMIMDTIGRKVALLFYSAFAITFTFVFGFSNSLNHLFSLRFLSGIGYGGLLPTVSTYLNEFSSVENRGRMVVILESMWAVGSIVVGLVDLTIGRENWRNDYYFMSVGYVILAISFYLKESPKFVFVKRGKEALEKLVGRRIREEIVVEGEEELPMWALFSKGYLSRTLMIWFVWFVLSFVYYGLFIRLPAVFRAKGLDEIGSIWFTFFMMLAQLPGYLSAAYFIERWGRKKSLLVYLIGTGISGLAFAFSEGIVGYATSALLVSFFCLGSWGLVYAYTPELFPTEFRGTATGTSGTVTRIGGIVAPYVMSYFISGDEIWKALVLFAVLSILAGFLVMIFGIETKGRETG